MTLEWDDDTINIGLSLNPCGKVTFTMCFELLSIQSMPQLASDLNASQMVNLGCDCSKQKIKSASSQDLK